MYSGGAAQSAPALNGSIKKASVPASHALHKDGGLKLPWYHLGSQHPRGHCLKTAAEFFLLTAGRFNGRTRRGLVLLLFVRSSETIFGSLFPALFHLPGSLVRLMRKLTLLFTAILVILRLLYSPRRDLSTP